VQIASDWLKNTSEDFPEVGHDGVDHCFLHYKNVMQRWAFREKESYLKSVCLAAIRYVRRRERGRTLMPLREMNPTPLYHCRSSGRLKLTNIILGRHA
jgi:hypothetical protein